LQSQIDSLSGSGSDGHTIQDEGSDLPQRTNLNFVGVGVTATDDSGNDATVVTISGDSGFTPIEKNGTVVIEPSGSDFMFSVSDYISKTEVENTSGNLQSQIDSNDTDISTHTTQISDISGMNNGQQIEIDRNQTNIVAISGNYVETLNNLQGDVDIVAGDNVGVNVNGQSITISASSSTGHTIQD